jgi:Ca2+-binding RTX toxin-like protein
VTLGADASADVGGVGHTLTLDDSAATGNLFVDASAMTANLKLLLDGLGNDILTGGAGNDIFQFNTAPTQGADQITNFNNTTQQDSFAVSAAGFGGGLTQGQNVTSLFESSGDNNFASANSRFHFDTANHGLYYSADGTTAHELLLATVINGATLHPSDIHVVA